MQQESSTASSSRRSWLRLLLALAAAEWAARALLSLMATGAGALLGDRAPERAQLFLGAVMLFAGVIEGALIGAAEAWAWGFSPRSRRARRLVSASAGAFGLIWLLGALASGAEPVAPPLAVILAVAAGAGALLGVALGGLQSLALGSFDKGWVLANMLAWASGMLVGAFVTQLVPDGPFTAAVLGLEALSGGITGAVVALSLYAPGRALLAARTSDTPP